MATDKTLEIFFQNCDEEYCSVHAFFSRFQENPASKFNCGGCDYTANSCPAANYLRGETDKSLLQFKFMEKFKYAEENREKKTLGWQEIGFRWVLNGHAKKFGELYDLNGDDFSFDDIFLSN